MSSNAVVSPSIPRKVTKENVKEVHDDLKKIFASGKTKPYEWRLAQLQALESMIIENEESMVASVMKDHGKKIAMEATISEFSSCLSHVQHTIANLKSWMAPKRKGTPIGLAPANSCIISSPKGVVVIMSPWNYPIQLALVPLFGAIAAGNCVLLKTSRHSPAASQWMMEYLPKYIDNEAIVVEGEGGAAFITELLVHQWDHIFFTGSVDVGRIVYQAAANHLTPVTLELGGKNPIYVDSPENVSNMTVAARRIAWGKWFNCGQTCIGCDYVLCHKDSKDSLIASLKEVIREFYGENPQESKSYPRVINTSNTKRVADLIKDGKVAIGGEVDVADCYIAPTVLVDVNIDSDLMNKEIFGPILPIVEVDNAQEAIEFINARPNPLAAYIFSSHDGTVDHFIDNTQSGAVDVNEVIAHFANPDLPFGGVGDSGIGAYHGDSLTFEVFSHPRACVKRSLAPW
eukprot:Ihof_evm11s42 gene=Ihof_evmTU11s42